MRKCEIEGKNPRDRERQGLRSQSGEEAMLLDAQGGSFFLPGWEKLARMDADADKFGAEADMSRNYPCFDFLFSVGWERGDL